MFRGQGFLVSICFVVWRFGLFRLMRCGIVLVFILLVSCSKDEDISNKSEQKRVVKYCNFSGEFTALLKKQLIDKSIKFEEEGGCLISVDEFLESFEDLIEKMAGIRPPSGRSMSWSSGVDKYQQLLNSNGIETEIYVFAGEEYLVWGNNDSDLVEEILQFEPWRKKLMHELREQSNWNK